MKEHGNINCRAREPPSTAGLTSIGELDRPREKRSCHRREEEQRATSPSRFKVFFLLLLINITLSQSSSPLFPPHTRGRQLPGGNWRPQLSLSFSSTQPPIPAKSFTHHLKPTKRSHFSHRAPVSLFLRPCLSNSLTHMLANAMTRWPGVGTPPLPFPGLCNIRIA